MSVPNIIWIASLHAMAQSTEDTDWEKIGFVYRLLLLGKHHKEGMNNPASKPTTITPMKKTIITIPSLLDRLIFPMEMNVTPCPHCVRWAQPSFR
jgi:hypothetical protein